MKENNINMNIPVYDMVNTFNPNIGVRRKKIFNLSDFYNYNT